MAKKDVVLAAYACSSLAPCTRWAKELFHDEPLVLSVPGSGETFTRKGKQWAATGDAFKAAISEMAPQYKNLEIGRRAMVTFSIGWQLGHELLKSPRERSLLNAYILEDGLHSKELDHWVEYATRAANTDAWMVMAHSRIKPPFVSARETNTEVFRRAQERNDQDPVAPKMFYEALPDYVANPEMPDGGVRISVGAIKDAQGMVTVPAYTKVWDKDPLAIWESRGNLWRLEYDGNDRPDHIFIAQEVAHRVWRMLADHWNPVV